MSETQRTLFNRRASGLLIAGASVLLAIVFVVRFLASDPVSRAPESVKERTAETEPRRVHQISPVFDTETYYRTIIDNNLFRPFHPLYCLSTYRCLIPKCYVFF